MASSSPSATRPRAAATRPLLAVAALVALLAFAFDSMHGQLQRNGFFDLLNSVIRDEPGAPSTLPGTSRPVLRHFTGVPGIDKVLVGANVFFAKFLDGSQPETTLFAFQFAGQLPAAVIVLIVESLRVAPPSAVLRSPLFWGMSVQALGFGVAMPLWCILYFVLPRPNPASADAARLRDPIQLHSVIPAFLLGFVFPSIITAYPYADPAWRQRANIFWQPFPAWVSLLLVVFTGVAKRTSIGQGLGRSSAQLSKDALDHAYGFAFGFAAVVQWITYSTIVAAYILPEELPSGVAARLTPETIFVPGSPHSFAPMESPGQATFDFLRYDMYTGSIALAIWAVTVAREAGVSGLSVFELLRDSVLVGPCAAAIRVLWKRDEVLLSKA